MVCHYHRNQVPLLVISLGRISLTTEPCKDAKDVASMYTSGVTSEAILKKIMDQAYDRFELDIQDIQILFAKATDNWQEALTLGRISRLHIIEPIALQVTADMCVVDDDPRLPKTRIVGKMTFHKLTFGRMRIRIINVSFFRSENPQHRYIGDRREGA